MRDAPLSPIHTAPQHSPRPLPLFLDMLREQTAAFPERRQAALAGLAAYQAAPRAPDRRPAPAISRQGRALLRDYGGANSAEPLVLFVPSLINPPDILDLSDRQSLLRWLAAQGVRPLMLDWGSPCPEARNMDVTDHVEQLLVPLVRALPVPPILVGYCLGGTMAAAAACLTPVAGLAMIAAPWRFSAFGAAARNDLSALWAAAKPTCDAMGLVPMEVLQSGFWRLDAARTISKYERFGALDATSDEACGFVRLEDWANAGAPLSYAAGRQMFEDFFEADQPGRGAWKLSSGVADPLALPLPTIDFVSTTDRIVPAASAAGFANRHETNAGHVGMVVGGRAQSALWEPLAGWISSTWAAKD
ncbi:MAG: alpha/beta fold hydrolase [Sphingomonas sp.]